MTSQARAEMAVRVHASIGSWKPSPVRRVYIPKAGGKTKMRPLGIPVIMDRCHQARVRHALEPEWEARFEPRSYGFRPGRGCHDAVESLFNTLRGKSKRVWIVDADLAGAFDKIDHGRLLSEIGSFPAGEMILDWLKAGVFEADKGLLPTAEGTPQGGVISPLLLNIALHGLEEAAGVRYRTGTHAGELKDGSPALTRYADDLVVCCHSRQEAEQVKARLAAWLEPRGLEFNETKTRIVHLSEGFDFLGFNFCPLYKRQAAHQTEHHGHQEVPREACEGVPGTTRGQHRSGTGEDRPDRPRLGRLLPNGGVDQGVSQPDRLPVETPRHRKVSGLPGRCAVRGRLSGTPLRRECL